MWKINAEETAYYYYYYYYRKSADSAATTTSTTDTCIGVLVFDGRYAHMHLVAAGHARMCVHAVALWKLKASKPPSHSAGCRHDC